jgi:hypothetical protein
LPGKASVHQAQQCSGGLIDIQSIDHQETMECGDVREQMILSEDYQRLTRPTSTWMKSDFA